LQVFADICGSFAEICGIFAGNFQRFRWQLSLCSTQPSDLKKHPGHPFAFPKTQGVLGVSGVCVKVHRFQSRETPRTRDFSRILNLQNGEIVHIIGEIWRNMAK